MVSAGLQELVETFGLLILSFYLLSGLIPPVDIDQFSCGKLALSPFTVIVVSIGVLPFFLALLSLIAKSTENELLVIFLDF